MVSAANRFLSSIAGIRVVRTAKFDKLKDQVELLSALREKDKALWSRFLCLPGTSIVDERIEHLGALLDMKSVENVKKRRIGGPADGGYVCLDDLDDIVAALSVGIGGDVSWDTEIADRNITVYQYDHTVDSPPAPHEKFVFHRTKLSATQHDGSETLDSILTKYKLSLPATVIAKIDIEGDEWDVLSSASTETLSVFSQLICEFHWFEKIVEDDFFERCVCAFKNLRQVFEPIHVHANNCSPLLVAGNKLFPNVLQVTFANRNRYAFDLNRDVFPGPLDAPCNPRLPDHQLGFFRYGHARPPHA